MRPAGQVGQRLARGQDAVAVGQGRVERRQVVGVALDGHHPAGPVVGRQHQGRRGRVRPAGAAGHASPARPKTTLATAEKSSRP